MVYIFIFSEEEGNLVDPFDILQSHIYIIARNHLLCDKLTRKMYFVVLTWKINDLD